MNLATAFKRQPRRQPHTLKLGRAKLSTMKVIAVVLILLLVTLVTSLFTRRTTRGADIISDKTFLPMRVIARSPKVEVCNFGNSSMLLIPDPAKRRQYMDVGCAYYCVQPPLSAEDEAAGVDPTMLAYDVTPDEAAAEVARRRSDPSYKWQDMFTCAWVPPEVLASTTCDIGDHAVQYDLIPPIANTASGPRDPTSPLHYVNSNQCPIDLVAFAATHRVDACEASGYAHTFVTHMESTCKYPVHKRPCGAEVFSTHRYNKDGSPRPFYTFPGSVRGNYLVIQSYARYVEGLASPALAATDAALQDELKPFYDRYIIPRLDTVSKFDEWSKRKSVIVAFIGKSYDGRAEFVERMREFYPVDNLGRYNRTGDTLIECEARVSERPYSVNGNTNISVASYDSVYSRAADAPSPLNTTAYSSIALGRDKALRCAQQQYKFVLVFENSIEEDYVTEKVTNGLLSGAIPILIGAPNIDEYTPDLECADANVAEVTYPSVHEPSGTATMNIKKPFINIVTEFGAIDLEKSQKECLAGRSVVVMQTANGTLPLQRLAEYLRWLETSPDAVERYLSWWRCSKWGAKFQSALNVPYYPCGVCARSHRQHQRDGRAYSLGTTEPFQGHGRRRLLVK